MKAAVLYQWGSPEKIEIENRPIPEAGKLEVLVKVKSFGLNRSEIMTRKGLSPFVKLPRILGIECAGEIEVDPSGEYQKGKKILAMMSGMGRDFDGSYAEFTVLPKSIIIPVDSFLSWEILGAIPEMYQTVYGSLNLSLAVQKNETILIRGASSSVGILATQVAKNMGMIVIATTRNEQKQTFLLNNGASHVLIDNGSIKDTLKTLFPQGVDKVLELVGAVTLKDSLECTSPGGTCCMTGMLSETWSIAEFAPMEFIPATVHLTVYDSGQIKSPANVFQEFIRKVEAGEIKINVSKVFSLDDIVEAHRFMESNVASGKIVVMT